MDCSSPLRLKPLSISSVIGSPWGVVVTGVKSDDVGDGDGAGLVPGCARGAAPAESGPGATAGWRSESSAAPAAGAGARSLSTAWWILSKSGTVEKEASKSGGPMVSRLTGWPLDFIARSTKLPSWLAEMLESTTLVPA